MVGLGPGLGLSQPVVAAGGGGSDLWPLSGMGVEADWAFTGGNVTWNASPPAGVAFGGPLPGEKAELTGSAKTSFDAAVSNSTACTVSLTQRTSDPQAGTVQVKMKAGTAVDFTFVGDPAEVVTHTVTSGSGSGFELIAGSDEPGMVIVGVQIAAA